MPQLFLDHIENLSLVERNGAIRSLTRKARVGFSDIENSPKDFQVLNAALSLLDDLKIVAMSEVPADSGYTGLVLVERSPSLMQDPRWVDIILKYEHLLDGPNQFIAFPTNGILYGKGRCSITQRTTNFYYPHGDRTKNRIQILVGHTYTDPSLGVIGQYLGPDLPNTIKQGGEINVPVPVANFQVQGLGFTENPWSVGQQYIARINKNNWLNHPPGTWICSEVQWDVLDPRLGRFGKSEKKLPLYRFSFEFQHDPDGWDPTVVFIDQRTGRPPFDVDKEQGNLSGPTPDEDGVLSYKANPITDNPQPAGYWTVPYNIRVDFNEMFGAHFEGLNDPEVK
jgi:hypothetical protein